MAKPDTQAVSPVGCEQAEIRTAPDRLPGLVSVPPEAMMPWYLSPRDRRKGAWTATSPEVPNWTVVADTYEEAHRLAKAGVRFALDRDNVGSS
jgi:hypothetical protein